MNLSVSMVTRTMFFDRLASSASPANVAGLRAAGALVRKIAQRSMRYRQSASPPGQPPSARTDKADNRKALLRKFIAFGYDPSANAVVVGPTPLAGTRAKVPGLHERGGTVVNQRRRVRTVGSGGEVRIRLLPGGSVGQDPAGMPEPSGRTTRIAANTLLGPVEVTYARIRTSGQAARANRIQTQLYGPGVALRYPARPYMAPALATSMRSGSLSRAFFGGARRQLTYAQVKGRI
jgi:hypothetical protein